MRSVVTCDTPSDAVLLALSKVVREASDTRLGELICVSEQGFDAIHDDDSFVATREFLNKMGMGIDGEDEDPLD
jgi:hypothetical protein